MKSKKAEEVKELIDEKDKKIKDIMAIVTSTPEGLEFMRMFFERSGFSKPSLVVSSTGINTEAMIYNEGRRNLYSDFRRFLSEDRLFDIEIKKKGKTDGN